MGGRISILACVLQVSLFLLAVSWSVFALVWSYLSILVFGRGVLRLGPYKGGPAAHCKPRLLSHHCLSFVQPLAYNNRWYSNQQHHLQNVCGLFPHVHLPTHFVRRTNQPYCLRTLPFLSVNLSHNTPTSELHRVLAGIEGVLPIPIVRRSHSNHISPSTLSR